MFEVLVGLFELEKDSETAKVSKKVWDRSITPVIG
jgi:hypothetical protein